MNYTKINEYTTDKGAKITTYCGELNGTFAGVNIITANGKKFLFSWRQVIFPDEMSERERESTRRGYERAGGSMDGVLVFVGGCGIREQEIADGIRSDRERAKQIESEHMANEAARLRAKRDEIIAKCPDGMEPVEYVSSFDGIATYRTLDGAEFDAWNDAPITYGIAYFGKSVCDDARARWSKKKAAEAEAANKAFEAEKAEEERLRSCFTEASRTGKPVVIRRWVTDRCHNGNDDECSFDNATEWANPDGTTKVTYTCCF